jgi:hypothetical protein
MTKSEEAWWRGIVSIFASPLVAMVSPAEKQIGFRADVPTPSIS